MYVVIEITYTKRGTLTEGSGGGTEVRVVAKVLSLSYSPNYLMAKLNKAGIKERSISVLSFFKPSPQCVRVCAGDSRALFPTLHTACIVVVVVIIIIIIISR